MIKHSLPLALAAIGFASVPVAANPNPVCYMDMHGVRTDLSYMCGSGEDEEILGVTGSVDDFTFTEATTEAGGELPVLLEQRINGSFLEFWVRNPRSIPSRETSAYYQVGYWTLDDNGGRDEYEIVSGYVDIGGSTETRERFRLNLRREHPVIPNNTELRLTTVDVLSSRFNR